MTIKMKAEALFEATLIVSKLIREQRPMPQKGKYRLAHLHAKLLPEFTLLNEQRDNLIKPYDHHEMVLEDGSDQEVPAEQYSVPMDKMPEFNEEWRRVVAEYRAGEPIELDAEPLSLSCIEHAMLPDGAIQAYELLILGDLVAE